MKVLSNKWNLSRIIRLILGIVAIVQGATNSEVALIIAGSIIAALSLLNIGCCGTSGCSLPTKRNQTKNKKEVIYEELVKEK